MQKTSQRVFLPAGAKLLVDMRPITPRDAEEILAIETSSFAFPWRPRDFKRALDQETVLGTAAVALAGEMANRIVGFVVYNVLKTRIDLLNVAVHPHARRRGVGRALLRPIRLMIETVRSDQTRIVAHVRESNLPAQLFFGHCFPQPGGFRVRAILRRYFAARTPECIEDAYLFVLRRGK